MKKTILTLILILFITTFVSCENDDFNESINPPLTEEELILTVPDFLTEEQQLLYRRAYSLYQHMFGGETSAIEYTEFMSTDEVATFQYETIQIEDFIYKKSLGMYSKWEDFDALIHSVFTDRFWKGINIADPKNGTKIYLEKDKTLHFIDFSRGSGYYYNNNFSDDFELIEKKDDSILFKLIGHYSPVWPRDGETTKQRDERRKMQYDYIIEFSIKMVLTDDGWRFDEFHSALADEAEFQGTLSN